MPDPRLVPFRDRVARLFREDHEIGLLLVRVEPFAELAGGHLWRRRWVTRDLLWLWLRLDGGLQDHVVHQDRFEGELRDLQRGLFRFRGEVLRLEWCTDEEAERLRPELTPPPLTRG